MGGLRTRRRARLFASRFRVGTWVVVNLGFGLFQGWDGMGWMGWGGWGGKLEWGRAPCDISGLAGEEVGHEDLVLFWVGIGEDISALNCLREEPEDVVDDEDGFRGCSRAGMTVGDTIIEM